MDGKRLDALARDLWEGGSRRRLLLRLSAVPLLGGLARLLGEEDAAEAQRRKNRGDGGADAERKKNKKKKKCKAKGKVCRGKCGTIQYKCKGKKKRVNCSSCACEPACDACFICNASSRTCEVDPAQVGDACGATGQVCQADGTCTCDADSCPGCSTCQGDGTCTTPCNGAGCCDTGTCVAGTSDPACGTDGETCVVCDADELCTNGACAVPPCTVCASGCFFDSVQEAIDAADPGDTITICEGTFTENLTIAQDLTIIGAGQGADPSMDTILDGGRNGSVVTITAGTVTIQQLRITAGGATNEGGGIYNETGATLNLSDCTVTDNDTENGVGTGIANFGTATIEQCTLTGNGLRSFGRGQPWGTIYGYGGSTTVTNSALTGNLAAVGAGIMVEAGSATLTGCDISGNRNKESDEGIGVGIFAGPDSTWTVTNCTINNNSGEGIGGGGICAYGQMTLTNCQIRGNTHYREGGGIYIDGSIQIYSPTVTLVNTEVTENSARNGGGAYVVGSNATIACTNGSRIGGNTPDQCVEAEDGVGCETCLA